MKKDDNSSLVFDSCVFCHISDGTQSPFRSAFKSIRAREALVESNDVILMPDISPIRLGHLLFLPRRHISSAADLNGDEEDQLIRIRSVVENFFKYEFNNDLLEFEHGAVGLRNCGGCINHCHIHFIPFSAEEWVSLKNIVSNQNAMKKIHEDFNSKGNEYLSIKFRQESFIWDASYQRSQFFRRIIATLIEAPVRANWINGVDGYHSAFTEVEVQEVIGRWQDHQFNIFDTTA